jgi:hypothetical protein
MSVIATYEKINEKMMSFINDMSKPEHIRMNVFEWCAEFGVFNYEYCKKIIEIIGNEDNYDYDEDGDKLIKKEPRSQIKEYGNRIYGRGGMTALRANFYTMVNFMTTDREVKSVEYYWDGVGEWKS